MSAERRTRSLLSALAAALLLGACRGAPAGGAELDAHHPAHPDAPLGVLAAPSEALSVESAEPPAPEPEPGHQHPPATDTQAEPARYACPMHPEVTSAEPGRCPKCGMGLEALETGEGGGHDHPRY